MVFSSAAFLFLFLPGLLICYYLPFLRSRAWRNVVLLVFSVGFYAWGEPVFVTVILASIFINWLLVLLMVRFQNRRKTWLVATIVFDVLLLGVFKYASFLSENLAALTGNDALIVRIALPIGISFFTFQLMSYAFDVYYGQASAQKNPLKVALYISLFPQLIAGPIVRYRQIEGEILDRDDRFLGLGTGGIRLFVYGLAKKVLLADFLAPVAENAFDFADSPSILFSWFGAIAYTLQIYFDFSGYSDMAIGLGRMFGFHFPENFNYPYVARNVSDFWKRWHISLTSWFRDYVYIPLGGNRVAKPRWILNLLIVWLLTGIWHGANWTFLLWGLIYFFALLAEKLAGFDKESTIWTRLWTFLIVVLAWVFFRSNDVVSGARYAGVMFGIGASSFCGSDFVTAFKGVWVVFLLALIGAAPILSNVFQKLRDTRWGWVENCWLTLAFCVSVFKVVGSTYAPFIYFNF